MLQRTRKRKLRFVTCADDVMVARVMSVPRLIILQVQYFKQRRVAEYEKEQLLKKQEAEGVGRR